MPRILRIINRFNLGGPTFNVAYLSKYLPADFETLLVGGAKDESEDSSEFIVNSLGLNPVIIPSMRRSVSPFADYQAYREIKKLIRDFKPDIVHTHASKAGALGRLAAYHENVPVIVHTFHGHVFHSYFGKTTTTVYKQIERYLARKSSAIVAISQKQKEELGNIHHICAPEKITVVPLGFDLTRFRDRQEEKRAAFRKHWQVADDTLAVVIVGRLVPVKNHRLFLEAVAAAAKQTNRKWKAFIVGDGESRAELEAAARELQLPFAHEPGDQLLTFTSWIRDVDAVYAGADIVALSSWNEGTPVSLIEAQAAGRAIVTTNVGGISDVVLPETTALLSPTGDAAAFTHNLLTLLNNDTQRTAFGTAGWPHVKEKFHYTRLVSDMEQLYRKLLAEKGL